jgi:hypothetical protein
MRCPSRAVRIQIRGAERFVREIGIVSCAKAVPVKSENNRTPAHLPSPPCSRSRRDPHCNMVWQKFDDDCHRCQHLSREVGIMNEQPKTTDQSQDQEESAYSLLIRSEEKKSQCLRAHNVSMLDSGPAHRDLAVRAEPGQHSGRWVKRNGRYCF